MELGLVRKVDIDSEMQQSYLDYAMSVIVARALPDARDGLKPVQRRVLYAMYDLGLRQEATYKKSARIVGEVLGKYHPHGDVAVYELMARLAQDFSMRYPLVDGQGNFGSVDGDPPAAMRYTEARLSAFAMEMLNQIDRDTVNFIPNFDNTLSEPVVLPAAAPNLLVNGASGIAVGMATNIPPHNLGEVVDALVHLLREWERVDDVSISDLMNFIKGPDFPTGGIVLQESGQNELLQAYGTGRGRVVVRGRVQKEDMERGKSRLIISELPYQVNKSSLIERIAELVRDGDLEGIADLRDESDRQGMRIVIELKAASEPEPVLRALFHRTPLESTFSIMLLALVDGEPRLLSLKQALKVYIEHRLVVIRRRGEYDLARAKARAHILEGLRIALANLDEIIALIKAAPDVDEAKQRLIKRFKLSEIQAQAILDMQLRRLASLERKKIEQEYRELVTLIHELESLLKSPKRIRQVAEEELLALKEKYTDKRRTQIVLLKEGESAKDLLTTSDLTPAQNAWIGIMEDGTIGRTHEEDLPRLSGRAAPRWLLRATTHHTLYLGLEDGRAAAVAVESLPEVEKFTDGLPINKVSPFEPGEPLSAVFALPPRSELGKDASLMTVSRLGMVKKSSLDELPGPSTQRFTLAKVNAGDALDWAFLTPGNVDVLLVTAQGMAIRFSEQDVRVMGLVAAGVNGLKLGAADRLVGATPLAAGVEVLAISSNGRGWRLDAGEFPVQGRYGSGVQLCKLEPGVRLAGLLVGKRTQSAILHFKTMAAKALRLDEIPLGKRLKVGQEVAAVKTGDSLLAVTPVSDSLAFWVTAEKDAKKKGKKSGDDSTPPVGELREEKQVQAALPGMTPPHAPEEKPKKKTEPATPKAKPAKETPPAPPPLPLPVSPPEAAPAKAPAKKAPASPAVPPPAPTSPVAQRATAPAKTRGKKASASPAVPPPVALPAAAPTKNRVKKAVPPSKSEPSAPIPPGAQPEPVKTRAKAAVPPAAEPPLPTAPVTKGKTSPKAVQEPSTQPPVLPAPVEPPARGWEQITPAPAHRKAPADAPKPTPRGKKKP